MQFRGIPVYPSDAITKLSIVIIPVSSLLSRFIRHSLWGNSGPQSWPSLPLGKMNNPHFAPWTVSTSIPAGHAWVELLYCVELSEKEVSMFSFLVS